VKALRRTQGRRVLGKAEEGKL